MRTLVGTDEIPMYVKAVSGKWHIFYEELEPSPASAANGPWKEQPERPRALTHCGHNIMYSQKTDNLPRLRSLCNGCYPIAMSMRKERGYD